MRVEARPTGGVAQNDSARRGAGAKPPRQRAIERDRRDARIRRHLFDCGERGFGGADQRLGGRETPIAAAPRRGRERVQRGRIEFFPPQFAQKRFARRARRAGDKQRRAARFDEIEKSARKRRVVFRLVADKNDRAPIASAKTGDAARDAARRIIGA